ncbi:MAG: hypothetical protein U1E09_11330 [Methylococcales bacterium]|uniref:RCC1 domain-containing protein n=1 Tax=Methylicorpusculum sp. TaxID=2713644 RepID=UPI002AB8AB0C|nr:hypothetical protein [Methylicorpusculum sp.]MDZ4154898.1 hypothetical protein [Methylicorpusculum sp.]MDZ4157133.1 hypothetical protein [Methylococcales bacterium]
MNRLLLTLLCYFISTHVHAVIFPKNGGTGSTNFSVQADGTVKAWGALDQHSPPAKQLVPVTYTGLTNVKMVSGTSFVKNDGTAWEVYVGNTSFLNSPAHQVPISNVTKLSKAHVHTVALKSDGTVWGWGDNQQGELGTGLITYSEPVPVQAVGLTGIIDISTGGSSSSSSYALKSDGTVWAWGGNEFGQFGNGSTCGSPFCGIPTPTQIPGLTGIVEIASGYRHTLILKGDGTVWATGDYYGVNFKQILGLSNIVSIVAGNGNSMALKSDGSVLRFSQGYNPTAVNGLNNIQSIQLTEGGDVAFATANNGTVYLWGNGYLGNGTSTGSTSPVILGVVIITPPPSSSETHQVPALSELWLLIMGAFILIISFALQMERKPKLKH